MSSKSNVLCGLCFVASLSGPALAGEQEGPCIIFFDKQEFEQFNETDGKFLKGIETFEESNLTDGVKVILPAPFKGNEPNVNALGLGFPSGLTEKNIIIQDNTFDGPNPPFPHPSGNPQALYVIGAGFLGSNSEKIGEDLFLQGIQASLDILFTEPNHTGVGFELSRFAGFANAPWIITAYNKNGNQICRFTVPAPPNPEPVKTFVGLWSPQTFGRINIFDAGPPGPDAIDNIQLWEEQVPTCPWDCGIPHNKNVDIIDFLALLSQWGLNGPCNFDGDAAVDITDFLKLLGQWGPCPAPANDNCPGEQITRSDPTETIEVHFDMYGATPSTQAHSCVDILPVKDIWYCLTYNPGPQDIPKMVKVSTPVPLLIEVTAGCGCPPGPVVACGFGAVGTPQFLMQPGDSVTIRLSNQQNLPNDLLKGVLIIENKIPTNPLNLFLDQNAFFLATEQAGKTIKFFWNFKPHNQPTIIPGLNDPLDINTHGLNVADPWTGPAGSLWPPFVDNVQFTSNTTPGGPLTPQGANGLAFLHPGNFPLVNNNCLVSNFFLNSFDIISGPPAGDNHTAFAFNIVNLNFNGPVPSNLVITVFDKQEQVLGTFTVNYPGGKLFVGILSKDPDVTIGRIDIFDPNGNAEGISEIWALAQPLGNACAPPGICGTFVPCIPGTNCFCFEVDFSGTGLCIADFPCPPNPCVPGGCPAGFACVTNTCCGQPVCAPVITCTPSAGAPSPLPIPAEGTPTASGYWIEPIK